MVKFIRKSLNQDEIRLVLKRTTALKSLESEFVLKFYEEFLTETDHKVFICTVSEYCQVSDLDLHPLVFWLLKVLINVTGQDGDLASLIRRNAKEEANFKESQVLKWILQLLNALEFLHSQSPKPIIHQDIKPS